MRLKNFKLATLLVFLPFAITARALFKIGRVCHISYNAINIIVWYMILPLVWAGILDYKLHQVLFAPAWLLLCIGVGIIQRKNFNLFCDKLFKISQLFILLFGNYYLWSVIICLIIPIVITTLLIIA